MILDETRERFLKAIAKQVDPARIAEIHFFAPIRQGGVESGVAVIAATERMPEPAAEPIAEDVAEPVDEPVGETVDESAGAPRDDSLAESGDETLAEPEDEMSVAEGPVDAAEESPYADASDDAGSADIQPSENVAAPQDAGADMPPTPIERHVIYTARYRLTLKGLDRGKWETSVTAEADAPIITVDAVVRGVQRRSGDVDDATRMSGDDIRAAIPATV
jgi:hypothetical protein